MKLSNILKVWNEELFFLSRDNIKPVVSDLNLEFAPITLENFKLVKELRGVEYVEQFKEHLSYGDLGYFAYVNGEPVAYGWVKHHGSKDFFFEIGSNCAYLCRFFTHEEVRGHNIYPALITALIKRENEYSHFYIDIEKGNLSSKKGLEKVGFNKIKDFKFFRFCRITLNKYSL